MESYGKNLNICHCHMMSIQARIFENGGARWLLSASQTCIFRHTSKGWCTAVTSVHSYMADSSRTPHRARQFTTTSNLLRIFVAMSLLFIVNFATWNVCGLSDVDKQHIAGFDSERYGLDIVAIQETKVCDFSETILPNGYKLLVFKQTTSVHGGLGFIISKRFIPYVCSWTQISDRVVYLDLILPAKTVNKSPCHVRIVNCYSPTLPRSIQNPAIIEQFYDELTTSVQVPSRYEVFVAGDFNAKLGKRTLSDVENGYSENMGKYGVGRRNENGERLLNFLISNKMFAANTGFQHSSRHITTRTGTIRDSRSRNGTRRYYSQIDYVLCKSRSKVLLQDSRAYAGSRLNAAFYTDHKIVCARLDFSQRSKLYKKSRSVAKKFNTTALICSKAVESDFKAKLTEQLSKPTTVTGDDVTSKFNGLFNSLKTTAAETVGYKEPNKKSHHTSDPVVVSLVEERRKLLNQLNNNDTNRDQSDLKRRLNRLKLKNKKRLKELRTEHGNKLAHQINSTDDSRKMFEAMRLLNNGDKKSDSVAVFNKQEQLVANDTDKADIVREWFKEHYTGDEPPLKPFDGIPRPLNSPITPEEVKAAAKCLKNGKAVGPDNIPNELLKHAPDEFYKQYAELVNEAFERHEHVNSFTEGYLTPLQKPGKPRGPCKSLRPLCLLNGTRKILSMVTLRRIQDQTAAYTGPWQCGYKPGVSCANIVWTQRILISVVKEKNWSYHKMGIDMTSAFDTIKRSTILRLLKDAGCSEDDVRLVRFLLANTKLRVKINSETSAEFESTSGAFQGDCLSGNLFTLTLAGGLHHLRAVTTDIRPNPPIADNLMPLEWEYADDVDFADEEEENLQELLPICTEILSEWNLSVNESKTEFTKIYLANKDDVDEKGEPLKHREEWRKSKSLGSKLCSKTDILHRCNLGNLAFQNFKKIWMQGPKINLKTKLKIYEAQVTSVMLYNCNSWAVGSNPKRTTQARCYSEKTSTPHYRDAMAQGSYKQRRSLQTLRAYSTQFQN